MIAEGMGFARSVSVSGQTYSRKTDFAVLQVLSGIAQSASKFAGDVRLLCHEKEVDEPAESGQIGSSAMAYKRNPMRSERIASLARYVISQVQNPAVTAASQWLERTLDDSANRRLTIPEAFLAADAILNLVVNVARGLAVYPAVCEKHLREELPFMATENILMYCVKTKGLDRQTLHERMGEVHIALLRLRKHAQMGISAEEHSFLRRCRRSPGQPASQDHLRGFLRQPVPWSTQPRIPDGFQTYLSGRQNRRSVCRKDPAKVPSDRWLYPSQALRTNTVFRPRFQLFPAAKVPLHRPAVLSVSHFPCVLHSIHSGSGRSSS